jgi:hypothetical protein
MKKGGRKNVPCRGGAPAATALPGPWAWQALQKKGRALDQELNPVGRCLVADLALCNPRCTSPRFLASFWRGGNRALQCPIRRREGH